MKEYLVKVFLQNSNEISFVMKANGERDILNKITILTNDKWFYYENANGKGYFKKEDVSHIFIQE
jgi:argonaute-like protein implicated in RNA metabolism and viral defense